MSNEPTAVETILQEPYITEEQVNAEIRATIQRVNSCVRIHKAVITRSVKTQYGDFFVGFNAGWESVQDDSMQDLDTIVDGDPVNTMTMEESRQVALVLGHYVEVAAIENAVAAGALQEESATQRIKASRRAMTTKMAERIRKGAAK